MQFTISRKPAIASPYILVRLGTNEIETGHNCVECRAERPLKNGLHQALSKYTTAIKMAVRMIQSNWNQ